MTDLLASRWRTLRQVADRGVSIVPVAIRFFSGRPIGATPSQTERDLLRLWVWTYRRTRGWLGGRAFGVPVLLLTTKGRKTGRSWTIPLLYLKDANRWVVVASNGGNPHNPDWWLNLTTEPNATIEVGKHKIPVAATSIEGVERERLWSHLVEMHGDWETFQRKCNRVFPVISLEQQDKTTLVSAATVKSFYLKRKRRSNRSRFATRAESHAEDRAT